MTDEFKNYRNEPGVCPRCGGHELDYGQIEYGNEEEVYYPYGCKDCGLEGREYYRLEFSGHSITTDEGYSVDLDN